MSYIALKLWLWSQNSIEVSYVLKPHSALLPSSSLVTLFSLIMSLLLFVVSPYFFLNREITELSSYILYTCESVLFLFFYNTHWFYSYLSRECVLSVLRHTVQIKHFFFTVHLFIFLSHMSFLFHSSLTSGCCCSLLLLLAAPPIFSIS